jgi:hypothetical protein
MRMPQKVSEKKGPPPLNERQRVLAQWRGATWLQEEQTANAQIKPASAIMEQVLGRLNIDRKRGESELLKVWNHIMDPEVVAHAQPTRLHKGTLFVSVDNSVWLAEIVRFRQHGILDRLQSSFGREFVKKISFRAG